MSAAEQFLMASILSSPQSVHLVRSRVPVEAFTDSGLRDVYRAACELADAGTAPTPSTIAAAKGYDAERLYALQMSVDDSRDVEQLSSLVADAHLARRVSSVFAGLTVEAGQCEPHRVRELVGDAVGRLVALSLESCAAGHLVSLQDATADAIRTVKDRFERRQRGEPPAGYTTGVQTLDARLGEGGVLPGRNLYIGAGPGTGKTALALHMVKAAAQQHPNVAHVYVTGETWAAELAMRHVAAGAGVPLQHLGASDGATMYDVGAQLAGWVQGGERVPNVLVCDKPRPSVGDVLAAVHAARTRYPVVGVVVVDHLHLMAHRGGENDERAIRATVEGLHTIAHRERVALVCLAQLNRMRRDYAGAPPMHTIRGAGAVEEYAHQVLMLGVEDGQDAAADPVLVNALVAKNRNGPVGDFALRFHKSRQRFEEA